MIKHTTAHEEGDRDSKILFLGQAPGRNEMRMHRPLVGPAGMVFNECLQAAGIARNESYILNVWPKLVETDKSGVIRFPRDPEPLWNKSGFTEYGLAAAQETLHKIAASNCRVVVPLGQQALALCTGMAKGIMTYRGYPIQDTRISKLVVPTVHPAATIHGVYLWRYLIVSDMQKAKKLANGAQIPNRHIILYPSLQDALGYMETCREMGEFATDLEVVNHQVSCFSLAYWGGEAMTVPLVDELGDYFSEDEEEQLWKAYADLMGDPNVAKVNQNLAGFDVPFLLTQNKTRTRGPIYDPMIAQSILYPEFRKGLDFLASLYTMEPYWKSDGKMWKEVKDYPTFWRYCGKDSCVALECWYALRDELTERDMWQTYDMTVDMLDPCLYMSQRGLKVDHDSLSEMRDRIESEAVEKEWELREITDKQFNPLSHAQCKEYFYKHLGLPPYKNAQGAVSIDDKALTRIARKAGKGAKEAKLVQEIRNLRKLKSTYLDVQTDEDGRLRCSWSIRGPWTGRLASSKTIFNTGANLQNLDPRFKEFIKADEDEQGVT